LQPDQTRLHNVVDVAPCIQNSYGTHSSTSVVRSNDGNDFEPRKCLYTDKFHVVQKKYLLS